MHASADFRSIGSVDDQGSDRISAEVKADNKCRFQCLNDLSTKMYFYSQALQCSSFYPAGAAGIMTVVNIYYMDMVGLVLCH